MCLHSENQCPSFQKMSKYLAVLAEGVGQGVSEAEMGLVVEVFQLLQEATNPTSAILKPLLLAHDLATRWMFRIALSLETTEDER